MKTNQLNQNAEKALQPACKPVATALPAPVNDRALRAPQERRAARVEDILPNKSWSPKSK